MCLTLHLYLFIFCASLINVTAQTSEDGLQKHYEDTTEYQTSKQYTFLRFNTTTTRNRMLNNCTNDKVPFCRSVISNSKKCKVTRMGSDYIGNMSHTRDGLQCQAWNQQFPHKHAEGLYDYEFPDYDVHKVNNFCRNPINDEKEPWCYTVHENLTWDYCPIFMCDVTDELNEIYTAPFTYTSRDYTRTIALVFADHISLIFAPLMIIVGTVTNMLSIKLSIVPSLRKLNTSFLMKVLAVVDMLSLNSQAWNNWILVLKCSSIAAHYADTGCKIYCNLINILVSYAGWVLCVITLERIIALASPLKAKVICSKKHSIQLLLLIFLIISLIHIPDYFILCMCTDIIFNENDTKFQVQFNCCFRPDMISYQWVSLTTKSLLPFTLLVIGNTVILLLFNQTLRTRRDLGVSTDPGHLVYLTKLLLATSFTYLLLTLPGCIYKLMAPDILYLYSSYSEYVGRMELWYVISVCLMYVNNSINFFLYCMAGKTIRDEFVSMMSCFRGLTNNINLNP